jgi:hypothetical protein
MLLQSHQNRQIFCRLILTVFSTKLIYIQHQSLSKQENSPSCKHSSPLVQSRTSPPPCPGLSAADPAPAHFASLKRCYLLHPPDRKPVLSVAMRRLPRRDKLSSLLVLSRTSPRSKTGHFPALKSRPPCRQSGASIIRFRQSKTSS